MQDEVAIREYRTSDKSFITNSWLTSYLGQSSFTKEIPRDIYFKHHSELVNKILDRKTSVAIVAVSHDDSDLIIGYLITETILGHDMVHYVYVKRAFNGLGICRLLFSALPEMRYATHITTAGKSLVKSLGLKYCPYFLFL